LPALEQRRQSDAGELGADRDAGAAQGLLVAGGERLVEERALREPPIALDLEEELLETSQGTQLVVVVDDDAVQGRVEARPAHPGDPFEAHPHRLGELRALRARQATQLEMRSRSAAPRPTSRRAES